MEKNLNSIDSNFDLIQKEMLRAQLNPSEISISNHQEEKLLINLKENAKKKKEAFEIGYLLLRDEIKKVSTDGLFGVSDDLEPISIEQFIINDKTIFSLEFWINYVKKPSRIQNQMNYSNNLLLSLYSFGTHFYEKKQYKEAIDSYNFICMLNPSISSFWIALGLSLEGNNELNNAFEAFERAVELTPFEIAPYIAMIRCSEKVHDFTKVIILLEKACENQDFKEEAKAALEYLSSLKN